MASLTLADLPPPPEGRTGWPWTVPPEPCPEKAPGGREWPKITVVTPSYNQARFLEATMRSVLFQGYPNIEYFVMDGGSTDGSEALIRRYAPFLAGWVSEKDKGQAHAINKGLARSTGDLEGYQNSDDGYLPGALRVAAEKYLEGHDFIYGHHVGWDAAGREFIRQTLPRMHPHKYVVYATGSLFPEAVFWSSRLRRKVGWLIEDRYSLDADWFYRMTELCRNPCHLNEYLAWFTQHENRKTLEKDDSGAWVGLAMERHPLADYLRSRRISRLRQLAGALLYVPIKRSHYGQFPLPFPKWRVIKRVFQR